MYIYGYLNRIRRAVQAFIQRLATYTNRVLTDGGEVQDADITRSIINHLYANGTYSNTRLLFVPEAGIKVREDGVNKFVTYGYDLADAEVDSDTELITNGSFDTDITGWSKPADLTGNTQLTWEAGQLKIRSTTASRGAATQAITTIPNKYYHVSFLAVGGDGRSRLLIGLSENDGGILDSGDMASDFSFDYTFRATAETTYITLVKHEGVAGTYVLFDSVSVKESINQANDLFQTTETEQPYLSGNIAPSEKLTIKNSYDYPGNLDFNALTIDNVFTVIKVVNEPISGKFEILFDEVNSGTLDNLSFTGSLCYYRIQFGAMTSEQIRSEYTFLRSLYPEIPSVKIGTQEWATSNCEMVATPMGNVIPEVESDATWISANTLYNNYLTANPGDEQGALKAAAMWCYYNNDSSTGAIYGKLYNWYAAKLLQNDIDAYNAAYPATPWGWRISEDADWNDTDPNALDEAYRHDGETYWRAGNTGTNENGFTALPAGFRYDDGSFNELTETAAFWNTDEPEEWQKVFGLSLRLIKE